MGGDQGHASRCETCQGGERTKAAWRLRVDLLQARREDQRVRRPHQQARHRSAWPRGEQRQ
jgi:DnaJ-class molecular chaperone